MPSTVRYWTVARSWVAPCRVTVKTISPAVSVTLPSLTAMPMSLSMMVPVAEASGRAALAALFRVSVKVSVNSGSWSSRTGTRTVWGSVLPAGHRVAARPALGDGQRRGRHGHAALVVVPYPAGLPPRSAGGRIGVPDGGQRDPVPLLVHYESGGRMGPDAPLPGCIKHDNNDALMLSWQMR